MPTFNLFDIIKAIFAFIRIWFPIIFKVNYLIYLLTGFFSLWLIFAPFLEFASYAKGVTFGFLQFIMVNFGGWEAWTIYANTMGAIKTMLFLTIFYFLAQWFVTVITGTYDYLKNSPNSKS